MRKLLIDTRREADLLGARDLRHLLTRVLEAYGVDRALVNRVALAVSEATANVISHAAPPATWLHARFGEDDDGLRFELEDDGGTFDVTEEASIPDPELDHGRGLALIRLSCDRFEHRPGPNGGNRLVLAWDVATASTLPRLMVVEDDKAQLALLGAYLRGDYEVFPFDSGEAALAAFADVRPDLVISDLHMPGLDGIGLRERLAADGEMTPFVVLTGEEDEALARRAVGLGVDDYLRKPIDRASLLLTAERVLTRMRQLRTRLEQRLSGAITATLVPALPSRLPGWRHALAVRDTGAGGGDLLLHRVTAEGTQLILIDVMGHDETAKFFAHACAGYLRGILHALPDEAGPADILERLSTSALEDELLSHTMLTCACVSLGADGRARVASAGHPLPWHVTETAIRPVGGAGMLPGLLPDAVYVQTEVELGAGERLALYTDGLYENADDNDARDALHDGVRTSLMNGAGLGIDAAMRVTMASFDEAAGASVRDDALLLLLEPER